MPIFSYPAYRYPRPRRLLWTGAVSNNWNTTQANWVDRDTGLATTFATGDSVLIAPATTTTITITGAHVVPNKAEFDTTNAALTINGTYFIDGAGTSVWIRGENLFTFSGSNNYQGGTVIGRLSDYGLYVCGGNNFSSWTTTNVSAGSAVSFGAPTIPIELGGLNPSCSPTLTTLNMNGHSGGGYSFNIVQTAQVIP